MINKNLQIFDVSRSRLKCVTVLSWNERKSKNLIPSTEIAHATELLFHNCVSMACTLVQGFLPALPKQQGEQQLNSKKLSALGQQCQPGSLSLLTTRKKEQNIAVITCPYEFVGFLKGTNGRKKSVKQKLKVITPVYI